MTCSFLKKFFVLVLLAPLITSASKSKSALRIENNQATVDYTRLQLPEPRSDMSCAFRGVGTGLMYGLPLGFAVGAGLAARTAPSYSRSQNEKNAFIAGLAGVSVLASVIGIGYKLHKRNKYRNMYDTSKKYNIHGVAADGNVDGIEAQADYFGNDHLISQDDEGNTPLMYAAACGKDLAAKKLIETMPKTCEEEIGKHETTSQATKRVSLYWWFHDGVFNTKYWKPAETTHTQSQTVQKRMLPAVDMQNDDKNTALHLACMTNSGFVMNTLLRNGKANPVITNKFGKTPWQIAQGNNYQAGLQVFENVAHGR